MSFDLNQELTVIECKLSRKQVLGIDVDYCYHAHRLGSRVPLFLFGGPVNQETWNYFGKIGNLLTFRCESNYQAVLCELLRRYGSIYTIVLAYEYEIYQKIAAAFETSPFVKSEIRAAVRIGFCEGLNMEDVFNFVVGEFNGQSSITHVRVENTASVEVCNAKMLQQLQSTLKDECLDWKWQYEQSDRLFLRGNLVLKNLEKWAATDCCGKIVDGTPFIPMKLMHDGDAYHSPPIVYTKFPGIGLVVDLSNDEGSYDKTFLDDKGIEFHRIQLASKIVPSSKDITQFIAYCKDYSSKHPDKLIAVHCHYGYNRTGLMICAFLIQELGCTVKEALERFREGRPPGIKHQNYIDKLHLRYGN